MDVRRIIVYVLLLIFRSSAGRSRMVLLRKIVAAKERRLKAFRRLQSHQRSYFVVFLSAVALAHLTVDKRSVEIREKQHLVGQNSQSKLQ